MSMSDNVVSASSFRAASFVGADRQISRPLTMIRTVQRPRRRKMLPICCDQYTTYEG